MSAEGGLIPANPFGPCLWFQCPGPMLPLQEHSLEPQILHHAPLPHTIHIHSKPKTIGGLITKGHSLLDLSVIKGIKFDVIAEVKRPRQMCRNHFL